MNQEYNMPPRMKPNMRLLVVPTHVTPAGFSQSTLSKDFDWSTVQEAVSSLSMQLFFAAQSDTLPLGSGVQLVQAIGLLDCWPGLNPMALTFLLVLLTVCFVLNVFHWWNTMNRRVKQVKLSSFVL